LISWSTIKNEKETKAQAEEGREKKLCAELGEVAFPAFKKEDVRPQERGVVGSEKGLEKGLRKYW